MNLSRTSLLVAAASASLGSCCLQAAPETSGPDGGLVDAGARDAGAHDAGFGRLPDCFVASPASVDFGYVEVGTTGKATIGVTNNCGIALPISVGSIGGTDPLLFATLPSPGTVVTVQDRATTSLMIEYTPLVASYTQSHATLTIKVCSSNTPCDLTIDLTARAVSGCLDVEPTLLDVGFTWPGTSITKVVTLTDICSQTSVHLTATPAILNSDGTGGNSPAGAFQPGAGFPNATDIVILPGQSLELPVLFTPPTAARFIGELDISTGDATQANPAIPLTGYGGGAVISCAPAALEFGLVAVNMSSTLPVVCTNVGNDVPGHLEANLFIPDPASSDQGASLEGGGPAFQQVFAAPFPNTGLPSGQSATINVIYQPMTAGTHRDTLVISSNGPPGSHTYIPLSGSAD